MRQGLGGALRGEIERARLRRDALLHGGRFGQQIECPEQRDRGRRMAGGDHRRNLVDELAPRDGLAGFGIARHQIEQVASEAGRALRLARIDDRADQREPTPAKPPTRDIARRRDPRRQQDLERRGLRQALAVIVQHGTHARREFRHRQREHRAAGGFDREAVHVFEEIDLDRLGGQVGGQLTGDGGDMVRHHRHGARREGGRHGAALHAPLLALGEQQAAAGDRIEEPPCRRGAGVILGIVDQHMADRGGAVQGQLHAAKQPALQHLLGEGALGERGQHVLPHQRGVFARRQHFAPGRGRRKARQRDVAHERDFRREGAQSPIARPDPAGLQLQVVFR